MSLLRVGVPVSSFVPFSLVENLRKDQGRLERIERLAFVENFVVRISAAAEKIRDDICRREFRR